MFSGVIIEESLQDREVLKRFPIVETEVEQVTENFKTPWLTQWTLDTIEVPDDQIDEFAQEVSASLDREHGGSWYADFKSDSMHYIIFCEKFFKVDRTKKDEYGAVTAYGVSIGIPAHQLNFSEHII